MLDLIVGQMLSKKQDRLSSADDLRASNWECLDCKPLGQKGIVSVFIVLIFAVIELRGKMIYCKSNCLVFSPKSICCCIQAIITLLETKMTCLTPKIRFQIETRTHLQLFVSPSYRGLNRVGLEGSLSLKTNIT